MVDEKPTRKYELKQRAEGMAATRDRITDATIELHGSVGPAWTTVAGIAERAGVQRHTVYRHFPTDDELFAACSERYWAVHPWPDVEAWTKVESGPERLVTALGELYSFYADVEPMLTNVLRDRDVVEMVQRAMATYDQYLDRVATVLARGYRRKGAVPRVLNAAVRHATAFPAWRSLVREHGLTHAQAVQLMQAMVEDAT